MTLREEYQELREQLLAIPDAAEKDGRKELTGEEQAKVAELLEKATEVAEKIKAGDESSALLKRIQGMPEFKDAGTKATDAAGAAVAAAKGDEHAIKTLGDLFVESESYKALKARYPNGFPERQKVDMVPVSFGGFARASEGRKDLVFAGTPDAPGTMPGAVQPDYRGVIAPMFGPLNVRSLFSAGTTDSDVVEYTRELRDERDNAAAPVPEAKQTAKSGDEASVKPESTFKFELAKANVVTIAHWIPVTRKALADVGQVRTLIDTFLRQGLEEELEHQAVNGDGTGENLLGLGNQPGMIEVPFSTNAIITIRKAKTALAKIGATATGVLLNPEDDEAFDLAMDGNDRFYGNGPFGLGPSNIWALPRVTTNELPVGSAYVGDFRTAVIYDREAATIQTGTIDDQFIRNMLTVLAEMRVAFAVWEPWKIAHVDLGSSSS
jgi:HK97 family phage major capsid protein